MNRTPSSPSSASRFSRRRLVTAAAATSAGLAVGLPMFANTRAAPTRLAATETGTPTTATGNFTGLVDIGGRSLWLEAQGTGGPTVILEAGAGAWADIWRLDYEHPAGERTMVLPGVAAFSRVYAYDRPGTIGDVNHDLDPYGPPFYPSRSDPMPQPRSMKDLVADLHALLGAAKVDPPYVLVGHSAGGLAVRLYASTYPDEVVGMVLIDATQEDVWHRFKETLPPALWPEFEAQTVVNKELEAIYPVAERLWTVPLESTPSVEQVRQAQATSPLRPMPLFVLSHGIPFAAPFPGWPSEAMERVMAQDQIDLAHLVPNAKHTIATKSGHNIHQDQPDLVIDAIQQVVAAVKDPSTWTT